VLGDNGVVPVWKVAAEVGGRAKDKHVDVGVVRVVGMHDHGGSEAVGCVGPALSKNVGVVFPLCVAFVMGLSVESAAIEDGEILLVLHVKTNLVAILHVGTNAREVDPDGNLEGLELVLGADAAELQHLDRVESALNECKRVFHVILETDSA